LSWDHDDAEPQPDNAAGFLAMIVDLEALISIPAADRRELRERLARLVETFGKSLLHGVVARLRRIGASAIGRAIRSNC
jgi:hypothetical protein